jgi:lauroyl/myristoyl acyltransferase
LERTKTSRLKALKRKVEELLEPNNIAIKVVRSIPLSLRKIFTFTLAYVFYHISLKHRLIAIHNVMRSFPEKPLKEIIRIAKKPD